LQNLKLLAAVKTTNFFNLKIFFSFVQVLSHTFEKQQELLTLSEVNINYKLILNLTKIYNFIVI
jgi:hypothetical protein